MGVSRRRVAHMIAEALESGGGGGGSAGDWLDEALDLSDLDSPTTARTNLGLGNAATKNTGTSAGTVAAGDDSRITGAAQKASNLSDLASASTARTNLGLGGAATLSGARTTAQATTGSLANGASENLAITLAKGYRLLAIQVDRVSRVRVYTTSAARTADESRTVAEDPESDAGVVLDFVATTTATYSLSPFADGANLEGSPTSSIPIRVTNNGSTGTVTVTLTYIATEV